MWALLLSTHKGQLDPRRRLRVIDWWLDAWSHSADCTLKHLLDHSIFVRIATTGSYHGRSTLCTTTFVILHGSFLVRPSRLAFQPTSILPSSFSFPTKLQQILASFTDHLFAGINKTIQLIFSGAPECSKGDFTLSFCIS